MSECSATCWDGVSAQPTQSSTYSVTTAAANGGVVCTVADTTTDTVSCNESRCPIDCAGSWGNFATCPKDCRAWQRIEGVWHLEASVEQTRTFDITTQAAYGGAECQTEREESQVCNDHECAAEPVDAVGEWSSFSA